MDNGFWVAAYCRFNCQALDIDRNLDGADLCDPRSPLLLAQNPEAAAFCEEKGRIITTTRVGITLAATLPLRFYLEGSDAVSRRIGRRQK